MAKRNVLVAGVLVAAATLSWSVAGAGASPSSLTCATRLVSTWSLTQVARETVVVSAQASSLASLESAAAQGYGGFLLFGSSAPAALPSVLASLRQREPSHQVPMVMTDDEGGGIIRFSNLVGQWPWAQVMGSTMTSAQITAVGQRVGAAMVRAGLNVDLAPVADVDGRAVIPGAADPDGLRSFGASPTKDAVDVSAFAAGLARAHVVAVVKHFPGLGGSSGNTDYGPAHTLPWSVLRATALVPFRRALSSGVTSVMMSNATVPGLTTLPASMSSVAIDYLRHTLGFHGLVMTDSLSAGAISALHLSAAQASVDSIAAGADQVLSGNPASPALALQTASLTTAALVAAVSDGRLTRAQLVQAASQVVATTNDLRCAD
jgi:beta-N-acetylhexosaminidase